MGRIWRLSNGCPRADGALGGAALSLRNLALEQLAVEAERLFGYVLPAEVLDHATSGRLSHRGTARRIAQQLVDRCRERPREAVGIAWLGRLFALGFERNEKSGLTGHDDLGNSSDRS